MADNLERQITDLDNFVYTASHDLKAPVSNLEGFITALNKKLENRLDDTEQKMFTYLFHSIARLKNTIQDLTEIVKIQKEAEKRPETISVDEIYQEVMADLQKEITFSQARMMPDFEVTHLLYTRKYLRSILYNLISNALKYHSPERTPLISIHTKPSVDGAVLSVSDNGLGIATQLLPKLFSMFKRFHTHVEGSGIGLYMIKRMVENHGGEIEVESVEGKGTTFKVFFKNAS
jgi:signal transduction histidine kinase